MALNDKQLEVLFRPLNPTRVAKRDGMSYLESWDVSAHLGRIFGVENWDQDVEYGLIFADYVTWTDRKTNAEKKGWDVAYHAKCKITLRDPWGNFLCSKEDAATGNATHQPSQAEAHDLAIKAAVSDALKRAARHLGNQFGISLYDSGKTDSVLGSSLAHPQPLADQLHDELPTGVLEGDDLEAAQAQGAFEKP